MRPATAILLLLVMSGCLKGDGASSWPVADPDDGLTTLSLQVVDAVSGSPLSDVHLEVRVAEVAVWDEHTDDAGRASVTLEPAATCTVATRHQDYHAGLVVLACETDQTARIPLSPLSWTPGAPGFPPGTGNGTTVAGLPPVPADYVRFNGTLLDVVTGLPIFAARVQLDPPGGPTARTEINGFFSFVLAPGPHILRVTSPCLPPTDITLDLQQDSTLDLLVQNGGEPPAAPAGLRATPGPGPGMVTLSWQDAPNATGYQILRNGVAFHTVAHSRAYGIPGASAADRFSVAAVGCQTVGVPGTEVSSAPLQGPAPTELSPANHATTIAEETFLAFRADGAPLDARGWRTVAGTGNCCENYVATTPEGRILDQGGSTLAFSDDEGRTWQGVRSPLVLLAGEGSVAAAPDGDIVAFDWAVYNGDTAFAYRYSAASKTWHTQSVLFEKPACDRPWIATIKGPFVLDDVIAPYATVVECGAFVKPPLLISLDGLTYVPSNSVTAPIGATIDLRSRMVAADANRDWLAPIAEFPIVALDNGLGVWRESAALRDTPIWASATRPEIPGQVLRVDSVGTWHSVSVGADTLTYAISHDGGATWDSQNVQLPAGWRAGEWDFRVNAALDQAVFAVNADVGSNVQQAAWRFRGLDGRPSLQEILYVGAGDGTFGSSITAPANRFDFMTLGFLPDGRIVMSAADARSSNPFLAIEL